jgi:hypothetical protein
VSFLVSCVHLSNDALVVVLEVGSAEFKGWGKQVVILTEGNVFDVDCLGELESM